MLFNLILGVLAGVGARYVEKPIAGLIEGKLDLPDADLRVLAFIACLLAASLLMGISGANGMPLMLLIGGGLGIFGSHVLKFGNAQKAALKQKMEERKASAGNAQPFTATAKDAAEAVKETATETAKTAATKAKSAATTAKRKTATKKPAAKK